MLAGAHSFRSGGAWSGVADEWFRCPEDPKAQSNKILIHDVFQSKGPVQRAVDIERSVHIWGDKTRLWTADLNQEWSHWFSDFIPSMSWLQDLIHSDFPERTLFLLFSWLLWCTGATSDVPLTTMHSLDLNPDSTTQGVVVLASKLGA